MFIKENQQIIIKSSAEVEREYKGEFHKNEGIIP
jgi:hypothetical protein